MDGNGRWAKARGLPRVAGHQAGVDNMRRILEHCVQREVKVLSIYAFSTENWGRPPEEVSGLLHALEVTRNNERITLNVAFNYGGRAEIIDAVRHMIQDGVRPENLSEELLSSYLYTANLPDPDMIIRTGGEWRLSNFLIWQAAYAEYYTTPTYWPDFDEAELDKALVEYSSRERRFGRVLQK
jgi:undecaprenyl diphosphate synthase